MFSVIFATHNGAHTLERTLEALRNLAPPPGGHEIIAVDNASTDDTADLLASHTDDLPLRVLTEPRKGKSFALNRGIEAARGRYLVFTDDDVMPAPDWLTAFAAAAAAHPGQTVFAGQVRHFWERKPPRWLETLAAEGRSFAGTPMDRPAGPIGAGEVKGANIMVRRAALERVRFNEGARVNYTGAATSAGGEDTLFVRDLAAAGHGCRYVPEASLRHIVRAREIGIRPVFARYYRIGKAQAATDPACFDPDARLILGYPAYVLKMLLWAGARGVVAFVRDGFTAAAREMIEAAMIAGRAREWRRERKDARPETGPAIGM